MCILMRCRWFFLTIDDSQLLHKNNLETINDSSYGMVQKYLGNKKFMLAWKECELLIEHALENGGRTNEQQSPGRGLLSEIGVEDDGKEHMENVLKPNTFDENRSAGRGRSDLAKCDSIEDDGDLIKSQSTTIKLITSQSATPILLAAKNADPNLNVAIVMGKTTSN